MFFLNAMTALNCFMSTLAFRSLGAKYQGPVVFKGIAGYHYTATLGDMSTTPEEKCYCPTPDSCLKKGAFDLSKCTGT